MDSDDARDIRRLFLAALLRCEAFAAAAADEAGLARLAAEIRAALPALHDELERLGESEGANGS
ncbi:MAG: hypothetical protein FIB06_08350 [Betaproteobacteria bacterium]|nr:hypothetical protein [Betaproteobacteria bacterium]